MAQPRRGWCSRCGCGITPHCKARACGWLLCTQCGATYCVRTSKMMEGDPVTRRMRKLQGATDGW